MERFVLKYELIQNEAIRLKTEKDIGLQEKSKCLKEIEEKDKLLKQYEVKVRKDSVDLNESHLMHL